jgi:hypothetical protein
MDGVQIRGQPIYHYSLRMIYELWRDQKMDPVGAEIEES